MHIFWDRQLPLLLLLSSAKNGCVLLLLLLLWKLLLLRPLSLFPLLQLLRLLSLLLLLLMLLLLYGLTTGLLCFTRQEGAQRVVARIEHAKLSETKN